LRFGNKGRNSFRTDIAILDTPVSNLSNDIEELKPHIKLIAEIKRDNADATSAKQTQVYPALDFLHDISAYGIYWDDVEQRLFYRTLIGTKTKTHETAIAVLPDWGRALGSTKLKVSDLRPSTNLRQLFEKIEDTLHTEVTDKSHRFEIMLQLLLAKLFDEYLHTNLTQEMTIQDFTDAPLSDADVVKVFDDLLTKAAAFFQRYLPKEVPTPISLSGAMLRDVSALIAPVKILGSKRDVVQGFYMYFAQGVYKWDLGQYFTPAEVVDFIVTLVNPQAGDQVKDPACGSGDFLISAFHHASIYGADLRSAIWGSDHSEKAVQVCVLNMLLNGDGKGNIKEEDSLANVGRELDSYTAMLCNPPFGVRIQERRFDVLSNFDLGHQWRQVDGTMERTDKVLRSQEVGLLFAELCVRQAAPGGRVGIILPNGYLGNKSLVYIAFREWLLRHTRLAAVVAFPRFTFKKSGADVSASVVVLEKRKKPLTHAIDSEDYPFYAGLIESVGWSVSDKSAERIYKRDPETGVLLTDTNNEPLPDADFTRVLKDLWGSQAAIAFPWLVQGMNLGTLPRGADLSIREVLARFDLSIDAKRWCERAITVRRQIQATEHFTLRDVLDVIPPGRMPTDKRALYKYVEIQDTSDGIITPTTLRGWQLPERARHRAQRGDIFVGGVWGSVGKWFVAGGDCSTMVVTNGFLRLRLKEDKRDFLIDLIAGLNTEAYRIQARSSTTGSDGLAELSETDLLDIVLPRVVDPVARETVQELAEAMLSGRATVASVVQSLITEGRVCTADVIPRSTNWVQV
jgi:type I restriction enzyme M protein